MCASTPNIAAKLPPLLMITPSGATPDDITQNVARWQVKMCIVRAPQLSLAAYRQLFATLYHTPLATQWIAHNHLAVAQEFTVGLHIGAALLHLPPDDFAGVDLSVSVHSVGEQQAAKRLNARFSIFGNIHLTPSHPERGARGWQALESIIALDLLPTYALGGLMLADLRTAQQLGAVGIAGISLFAGAPPTNYPQAH